MYDAGACWAAAAASSAKFAPVTAGARAVSSVIDGARWPAAPPRQAETRSAAQSDHRAA